MARDVLGMSTKRVVILLAVMAAVMFLASSLSPGEPDAQTTALNGKIVYSGFDPETNRTHIYTMIPDGSGVTNLTKNHTDVNWARHASPTAMAPSGLRTAPRSPLPALR